MRRKSNLNVIIEEVNRLKLTEAFTNLITKKYVIRLERLVKESAAVKPSSPAEYLSEGRRILSESSELVRKLKKHTNLASVNLVLENLTLRVLECADNSPQDQAIDLYIKAKQIAPNEGLMDLYELSIFIPETLRILQCLNENSDHFRNSQKDFNDIKTFLDSSLNCVTKSRELLEGQGLYVDVTTRIIHEATIEIIIWLKSIRLPDHPSFNEFINFIFQHERAIPLLDQMRPLPMKSECRKWFDRNYSAILKNYHLIKNLVNDIRSALTQREESVPIVCLIWLSIAASIWWFYC